MNRRLVIKKKSITFLLLMLCITAVYGTNYWLTNLYTYDFMVLTSLILSVMVFVFNGIKIEKTHYKTTISLTILMWGSGIIVAQGYGLPAIIILKESLYTLSPLMLYLAFRPMIRSIKDTSLFFHVISMTGIICNWFSFIEMFFALRGIDLLHMGVFEKLRNGTPRFIIGETIIVLSFFISCSIVANKGFSRNKRICHILNIFITIVNLIWIIKTRTLSLYLLASVLMIPFLKKDAKKQIKLVISVLAIIIVSFAFSQYFIPLLNDLIDNDYGVQTRFSTVEYYLDHFKKHWLFGVGYISAMAPYSTASIVVGPFGRYYPSDVGVIGLMFRSGIIGLAWLVSWFYSSLKIIRDNSNNIPAYYDLLMKLFIVFLLFSCSNLILTDKPRFPYIALGMLMFESSYFLKNIDKPNDSKLQISYKKDRSNG
ncbi:hypothetical protein MK546_06210 [Streptococcus cristatus]|uniref:Uncharacterized protein n=1 Tax=Streptococcus cristatus TaxID=45634 RepID=A0AAW5WNE2_STRCR|nr:hypothetical protein [Streptococcus cristatus]MCY7221674.1 hypothetical protein [Streptococcus cristatus]